MIENSTAFKKGYFAAKAGTVVGNNPYPEDSEDHFGWMNGWTWFHMENK